MYGPTSNSNFDSLFLDDDDEHHSFYLSNNMLTPDLPTETLLNPNPNPTDHHNYTYPFNSPTNNFLHYSPTPTYYDDFSLSHFLAQYQHQDDQQENDQLVQPPPPPPAAEAPSKEKKDEVMKETSNSGGGGGEKKAVRAQRRRAVGKTDRHSKIYTAQGARDRRMRLSLPIARRFFDLQDMLGFDKASKTIEWLFHKSKSAIKDALNITLPEDGGLLSGDSSSESEVVSVGGSEEVKNKEDEKRSARIGKMAGNKGPSSNSSTTTGGCAMKDPMVARESRDKARARARERTREKMTMSANYNLLINHSNDSSSSSFSSSIVMDYPLMVRDSHTHQNPRAPNIPQDLQLQSSAWDEYSNIGTRYGNNSFY